MGKAKDDFNPHLRQAILGVVDNQLRENDPPEARETLARLIKEGHPEAEARELIGSVVAVEIYEVMNQNRPFNRERFVAGLKSLPRLPFESDE